jgi:adenine-specific DNA-methyltransferase
MNQPEKLTGTSLDISAENRSRLKALFPTVFTETKNDKGELVESIDFEKLKAELGTFSDVFESRRERYGMDWPGKKEALHLIQTPSAATLKPFREESVNFDTTENLFIEGDNLEVLKLLQKSYYGKVKMIYIDPPYNTGKEFIYPDNYTESLDTYLEYAGLIDGDGKKFSTNTANEGRFHTKWLNMMYPRLYLARNLLRDDGVIFLSIDDNEVSNLRKMCDEIFGEENFLAQLVWERAYSPKNDAKYISNSHDYVLMFAKNIGDFTIGRLPRTHEADARYQNTDNDPRGVWKPSDMSVKTYNAECDYPIKTPAGRVVEPPTGRCWRLSKKAFIERLQDNRIYFGADGNSVPCIKRFLSELKFDGMAPTSIMPYKEVGHSQEGAKEVTALLETGAFDGPKPVRLLRRLLTLANTGQDSVILDFFSGSSTTAHAVLDLNKQDSGNRKFILVQLPEPCAPESEAFKAGYKTIADIGKERIRRVVKKINFEQSGKLDLSESGKQDLGFKVLKLDKSNFRQWQQLDPSTPVERVEEELFKHIMHISDKATPEDLLYEILLKAGFTPTEKIETRTIAGKSVFSIADGALLLCLEAEVTNELIDFVADLEPMQFICLDSAFHGNDQLKANAVQTFTARNMQKEKHNQIIFKTV